MTRIHLFLLAALQAQWSHSQDVTLTLKVSGEKAIIPTSSGQIGVNPVTDIPPESYQSIGPNTQWYQTDGGTTKWIGVNTEYLTDLPYTTTVDNQPSVTTAPAAIVVVTATASGNDIAPGDVSIAFSPKLLDVLNKLASEAEAACGGRRKRQACDANQRFAQSVAEEARPGGLLDFVDAEIQSMLPTVTASDVAAIMHTAKVTGSLISIVVAWKLLGKLQAWTLAGASLLSSGGNDDNDKCPADAPKGDNAPLCTDDECKGDNTKRDQKCAEGKYKGCDCLATAEVVGPIDGDTTVYDNGQNWMDEQQKLLQDLIDEGSKPPFCVYGGGPNGDSVPKEYCSCGDDALKRTLTYSVATSTTSPYNPCPYTTDNGPTVTFVSESTAAPSATPSVTPSVTCSQPQDWWLSSNDGLNFANQFCIKHKDVDNFLRPRPAGRGFSNGVVEYYNVDKDPMIRIYAYMDDACRDKGGININADECIKALNSIMQECDKDTEDKKMGGEATIDCQYYNIAAIQGPGNTNCPTCISGSGDGDINVTEHL